MRDNSTHIRITTDTRERLLALVRSLETLSEQGRIDDCRDQLDSRRPGANAVSMDTAINVLLDLRDAHTLRARKSAEKRRAGKRDTKKGGESPQEK